MTHETQLKQSLEAFLALQARPQILATIEPVPDDAGSVTLTPWQSKIGCLCYLSLRVPRAAIASVTPTGANHACCGKIVRVVEVEFATDHLVSTEQILGQVFEKARSSHPSAEARSRATVRRPDPSRRDIARSSPRSRQRTTRDPRWYNSRTEFNNSDCDMHEIVCMEGCAEMSTLPDQCACNCYCEADWARCTGNDFDLALCLIGCPGRDF